MKTHLPRPYEPGAGVFSPQGGLSEVGSHVAAASRPGTILPAFLPAAAILLLPAATKADEELVSEYQSLAYSRKYQSEDALKQTESRIRNLEDQLHRSRINPWMLWHTGLMSDERIVQEMAQVFKDRRAHEIIFRLCSDLVDAINSNYVGPPPPSA